MKRLTVVCTCLNSFVVFDKQLDANPSGVTTCKGLTKEKKPCGRQYSASDLRKIMDRSDVWDVPATPEQMNLNENRGSFPGL